MFGIGHNNSGQLGCDELPDGKACTSLPVQISLPKSVKAVACGWEHCAAVSADGELYMWGRADAGQCGVPPQQSTGVVRVALGPPGTHTRVESVSCGMEHTLAIDLGGSVYSWGKGFQLGHGEDRSVSHVPKKVEGLRSYWAIAVAAGGRHSVVLAVKRAVIPSPAAVWLASIEYQIWAWGENESGQLGVGDTTARAVPNEVSRLQSLRWVVSRRASCATLSSVQVSVR